MRCTVFYQVLTHTDNSIYHSESLEDCKRFLEDKIGFYRLRKVTLTFNRANKLDSVQFKSINY